MNDEMRQLLAEASVIAEAAAMTDMFEKPTSHGKPGSTILVLRGHSTLDEMARRFARCHTAEREGEAIRWARAELDALKGRNRPKPRRERTMILQEWAGVDYKEVSKVTCTAQRTVRRWREEAGLDPNTGERSWEVKFRRKAA